MGVFWDRTGIQQVFRRVCTRIPLRPRSEPHPDHPPDVDSGAVTDISRHRLTRMGELYARALRHRVVQQEADATR